MSDESEVSDRTVVPEVEEQVFLRKVVRPAGGVRVRTVVTEEEVAVDEALASEEVEIERVPVEHWVDGPVPVRREGDTTIVTLVEEVLVVETRLRATEEIRITRRRSERREPRTVTLRREEAVVEPLAPEGGDGEAD